MKKDLRDNLLGWVLYVLTLVVVFGGVYFIGYEKHDSEEELKLIKRGDLVMCTAEKLPINVPEKGTPVHIVAAMSVAENVVKDRELRGWILNSDAVVNGVVGYEELHKNCDGEVIFAEAESKIERVINNDITTKGLPLEIIYLPALPIPTQSF